MSRVTEDRCDRCGANLAETRYGTGLTVEYHHPKKLDLCQICEGEFMLWLGKHPLWGTPIKKVADGHASGDGYPSKERAREFLGLEASDERDS